MTPRERVIAAIELKEPDGVPLMHAAFPGVLWRHGEAVFDLWRQYPDDFGDREFFIPPRPPRLEGFEEYSDEWGCVWRRQIGWSAGEVVRPPLADWKQLDNYQFPPPAASKHFNEAFRPDLFAVGPLPKDRDWYALYGWFDLCERMQFLRGTANLLMDIADEEPRLHELADRIVERNLAMLRNYIALGVDGVFFGDDWGTQTGPLVSPRRWREFFKPRYRRMFQPLKEAGKHIFFHSCGNTAAFWDDLIELGVDVLNIQHSILPRSLLEEKLAGRICICSDPGRQRVMPFGTPAEVKQHIREIVEIFGRRGGLIQRSELAPDWPLENCRAMLETFAEFRPTQT